VTFNQQQRSYIEGLLRDADDQRLIDALEDPDGLFVKNLENVQGDERDVILFSTAFSVNDKGVLPLNFGPLNRAGGERRLNVAVTRARRQVVVFSSFDPGQLRPRRSV
jgi:superfamily I DNA and/or RNA helicase